MLAGLEFFSLPARVYISVVELPEYVLKSQLFVLSQLCCSSVQMSLGYGFARLRFRGGASTPICLPCGCLLEQEDVRITAEEKRCKQH